MNSLCLRTTSSLRVETTAFGVVVMLGPFIIAAPTALGTGCVREISPQDKNQHCDGRYITQFQCKRSREVYSPTRSAASRAIARPASPQKYRRSLGLVLV